jgi:hypothetical protein
MGTHPLHRSLLSFVLVCFDSCCGCRLASRLGFSLPDIFPPAVLDAQSYLVTYYSRSLIPFYNYSLLTTAGHWTSLWTMSIVVWRLVPSHRDT